MKIFDMKKIKHEKIKHENRKNMKIEKII